MKKLITLIMILSLISSPVFAANEWRGGSGEETILGTENVSDIDTKVYQDIVDPLDRLLNNYRENAEVTYTSASTITIQEGEVSCQNSGGTVVKFRKNDSDTILTWADIDQGAEANSTTYYVYAVCDADATTFTGKISTNSSTPTGLTSYTRLGQFYNDSDGDIEDDTDTLLNDNDYYSASIEVTTPAIATVYDYGTSGSSSTTKTSDVYIAYGQLSISDGLDGETVTNLPFTGATTYKVTTSNVYAGSSAATGVVINSGSQFTLYHASGGAKIVSWIAIGT